MKSVRKSLKVLPGVSNQTITVHKPKESEPPTMGIMVPDLFFWKKFF